MTSLGYRGKTIHYSSEVGTTQNLVDNEANQRPNEGD